MAHQVDELIPTRWSLIGRLKQWDDQESWREFFELYWKLIYGVALKAELNPDEAQDVVQDTIISVCKNIKNFKADPAYGSFKGWLLKLTRWRIVDQIRRRSSRKSGGQIDASAGTSTVANVADPSADVLDRIWENEWERNILNGALEKLERQVNGRHYQIFYLHVIKQKSVDKVAQATGVSANQVHVIKHRLSPLFRKAIEDLEQKMEG